MKREQWLPDLGRIPACLSCWPQCFHAVIIPADNVELRGSFSQDPQHTATHSGGVTQTSTTEHIAKPELIAGRHTAECSLQVSEVSVEKDFLKRDNVWEVRSRSIVSS